MKNKRDIMLLPIGARVKLLELGKDDAFSGRKKELEGKIFEMVRTNPSQGFDKGLATEGDDYEYFFLSDAKFRKLKSVTL